MTANFFRGRNQNRIKKLSGGAAFAAATATIAFSLVFSYRTERAEEIVVNKSYYFLVAAEECSESCLAEAFLSGGAGVELRTESGEYAVLACYAGGNGKEQAQEAQKTFSDLKKEETMIVPRGCGTIYLRTREQKRRKNEITGILNTLDGCADALYFAAKAAENGKMGQSALKETAKSTALVCSALAKSITGKDGASKRCAELCKDFSADLKEISSGIVYARDLRRMQAEVCMAYLAFSGAYTV